MTDIMEYFTGVLLRNFEESIPAPGECTFADRNSAKVSVAVGKRV